MCLLCLFNTGFLSKLHGSALTAVQAEPSCFPNCPANLFVFAYAFFFFETWRIAIRQFQVVWVPEDNHILEPLDASHTHRGFAILGGMIISSLLFFMPCQYPLLFSQYCYRFFTPFPPIMSIQPYNHTKNSVRKQQPPQKPTQHCAEPTFWVFFFFQHLIAVCVIFSSNSLFLENSKFVDIQNLEGSNFGRLCSYLIFSCIPKSSCFIPPLTFSTEHGLE